jgi:hypothetical protein
VVAMAGFRFRAGACADMRDPPWSEAEIKRCEFGGIYRDWG